MSFFPLGNENQPSSTSVEEQIGGATVKTVAPYVLPDNFVGFILFDVAIKASSVPANGPVQTAYLTGQLRGYVLREDGGTPGPFNQNAIVSITRKNSPALDGVTFDLGFDNDGSAGLKVTGIAGWTLEVAVRTSPAGRGV